MASRSRTPKEAIALDSLETSSSVSGMEPRVVLVFLAIVVGIVTASVLFRSVAQVIA